MGCYIAKLFTERYLHGKIEFHSDEHDGTRFSVQLPKEMSGAQERT